MIIAQRPLAAAILVAVLSAGPALAQAGPALAQAGPTLPKMPMPPSASDPTPKEAASPRAAKRSTRKAAGEEAQATPQRTRGKKAAGQESYERPGRYVPEEFDRSGQEGGSRAKPFIGENGRPGMGMQF